MDNGVPDIPWRSIEDLAAALGLEYSPYVIDAPIEQAAKAIRLLREVYEHGETPELNRRIGAVLGVKG